MPDRVASNAGSSLVQGAAWMLLMRWALRCIGLLSTLVLARLLTPADFGLVALAMIFVGFFEVIGYAGVDLALMRRKDLSANQLNAAWTLQLLQGGAICFVVFLSSWMTAYYLSEPRIQPVLAVLSLKALLGGLRNIGIVYFLKDLNFRKEFAYQIVTKAGNFLFIVGAAIYFRNYWALVFGAISSSVIGLLLSYWMHSYRPRISFTGIGEFFGFSQWLLLSRLGSYLGGRIDQFLIGGGAGAKSLGHYHMAYELSTLPTTELVMPMRRALYPTLSTVRENGEMHRALFSQTLGTLAILCFPIGFGFASTADLLIPVVLGPQWVDAAPLAKWLAVHAALGAIILLFETALWVQGRPGVSAARSWGEWIGLALLLAIFMPKYGVEGAAMARVATSALALPITVALGDRFAETPVLDSVRALWRPLLASLVMSSGLHLMDFTIASSPLLSLILKIIVGATLYAVSLLGLWYASGSEKHSTEGLLIGYLRNR